MTRIMRDSINASSIPPTGMQLVAGYANGQISEWSPAGWDRFADDIPRVIIDVNGTALYADVLDVENGDATVETAVNWVKKKLVVPHDFLPIIYCNRSTLTPLFNAMQAAGYRIMHHFLIWIGTLDGTKSVPDMTGVVAVQYQTVTGPGINYDESIVYDDAWKPTTPPPAPAPAAPPRLEGVVVQLPSGITHAATSTDGGKTWQ
jgi:hypothetical protein